MIFSPSDSTIINMIYFFGSFLFLIGRTVAVTLLAARINDQSKVVLPILYNCPTSTFTIEVILIFIKFSLEMLLKFEPSFFHIISDTPIISNVFTF